MPVLEYLIAPEIKHSILRQIEGWEIIEKHLILDVLHHGPAVKDLPFAHFTTTNKVAAHYGVRLNNYDPETIARFRYDKTLPYLEVMGRMLEEGQELKEKFMMREAIRQTEREDW